MGQVKAVERAMVAIRRSQTRRALTRLAEGRDDADDAGVISSSAVDVLDAIEAAEQAGTPATVSRVAATLNVDQPRASKLVAAAVEAGLVRREADQTDGRRTPLVRTERGDVRLDRRRPRGVRPAADPLRRVPGRHHGPRWQLAGSAASPPSARTPPV